MPEQMEPDGEANLVLELTVEPLNQTLDELFGLDDEQLAEVTATTIAHLQIDELVKISVLVTDDENLRMLNREYRDQDKPTDVLSFPAQDAPLISAPADQLWQHADDDDDAEVDADEQLAGANGATPGITSAAADLDPDADYLADELDESDDLFDELDDEFDELDEAALDLGDIAISYEAVKRQAAEAGHSVAWEFCYLLVHGVLHLAGYDDQTEAGYNAMVKLQDEILADANIRK
jgi:probable rRNA maturation factor